ncbi:hypothetical protein HCN51_50030 [Nonomuraea sp. FMUSA5-5]|uniref:DUF5666 domain-containing protein n=1 Tax=Nonomuraea composti TaxID=2720023 RepID=A0ABX1BLT2_9ACTN|nr:hypothetical protein [Nonomuraea sp. FMUSA5-5]NJP97477.1 hypothetical protein [Nonomuraea sp. FMUSA5-5]
MAIPPCGHFGCLKARFSYGGPSSKPFESLEETMLKQRLATIATAVTLGLGGVLASTAGTALAADGPVPGSGGPGDVHVKPHEKHVRFQGRLTCRTSDGKLVKLSKAKVAELIEERVIDPEQAETVVEDGVVVVPENRLSLSVPGRKLPAHVVKVKGKHWKDRIVHLTCVWGR